MTVPSHSGQKNKLINFKFHGGWQMHRIIAAAAALLMPSMAAAGTTWDTACDTGDGRIRGWNFGSATPRGSCLAQNGDTITSFRVEVPGTQFGKRRRTLNGFGERTLLVFPLGSSDPVFHVYLQYNVDSVGEGLECSLFVDYNVEPAEDNPPILEPTTLLLSIVATPNQFAFAGNPAETDPQLRQYIDTHEGHTLRTEDLFVQLGAGDCYGAGIFRYADDPRKFYER